MEGSTVLVTKQLGAKLKDFDELCNKLCNNKIPST